MALRYYTYNALNQLTRVVYNDTLVGEYAYDVLGRRIARHVPFAASGGGVTNIDFAYHGDHIAYERTPAGTMTMKYTYGPGIDNLVALRDGAGTHYYVATDRIGSIRTVAKRDGTWMMSQRFGPYGERIARDSSSSFIIGWNLRFGWGGREHDAETGFTFHRARYYSPLLRRFVQEDPLWLEGGPNPYQYGDGAPLDRRDPFGLESCYDLYRHTWLEEKYSGKRVPGSDQYVWIGSYCTGSPEDDLSADEPSGGGGGGGYNPMAPRAPTAPPPEPSDPDPCNQIREAPGFAQTVSQLRAAQTGWFLSGGMLLEVGVATDMQLRMLEPMRLGEPPGMPVVVGGDRQGSVRTTWQRVGGVNLLDPLLPAGDVMVVHMHIANATLSPADTDAVGSTAFGEHARVRGIVAVLGNEFSVLLDTMRKPKLCDLGH